MSGKLHHEVSSAWLPKQDLNKDGTTRHANIKGENITELFNPRQKKATDN